LAGPNGAGKSTLFETYLAGYGLPFVNADLLARDLNADAYAAARVAEEQRVRLVEESASFIFETVLSDPVGDKIDFLKNAHSQGFEVVLFFVGISGPQVSESRVAQRVTQGGHDVPANKLQERYPRIMQNLERAMKQLPHVVVFDNDDLRNPYRLVAATKGGKIITLNPPISGWLNQLLS
jgi:predicted ABC-type ATPase